MRFVAAPVFILKILKIPRIPDSDFPTLDLPISLGLLFHPANPDSDNNLAPSIFVNLNQAPIDKSQGVAHFSPIPLFPYSPIPLFPYSPIPDAVRALTRNQVIFSQVPDFSDRKMASMTFMVRIELSSDSSWGELFRIASEKASPWRV